MLRVQLVSAKTAQIHRYRSNSKIMIKVGGSTICCVIHKLIKYILDKEELREQWKDLIVLPVCKKHYKTECSNFRDVSLLSSAHKIPSNILLSMLTSYAEIKCCGSWM